MPAETQHEGVPTPNRYDPFNASLDSISLELASEGAKELAENQPNRVRNENGVTQRLVKYADGKFEWQPVNEQPNAGQGAIETSGGAVQEQQPESRKDDPFDVELAKGLSALEAADEERAEDVTALKEQVAGFKEQVAALQAQIAELQNAKSTEPEKQATPSPVPAPQPAKAGEPEPDTGKDKDPQPTKPATTPQVGSRSQRAGKRMVFENGKAVIKDVLDKDEPEPTQPAAAYQGVNRMQRAGQQVTGFTQDGRPIIKNAYDKDPAEKEKQPGFTPEIPAELEKTLADARDEYAKLTAENRSGYLGNFLSQSKFLAKINVVKRLADHLNERIDERELGPAREAYRAAVYAVQDAVHEQCHEKFGENTPEAKEASHIAGMDVAIQSELAFEMTTFAARLEKSGKTNKIVNWWVRQKGLGGKFWKAGAIAGVGFGAGLVLGLAGAPLVLGAAAGAAAGAMSGAYISRKRASGVDDRPDGKESAEKKASLADNNDPVVGKDTLADRQGTEDYNHKEALFNQAKAENGKVSIDDFINITEGRTGSEKTGNRSRVRSAASIGGAVGGALGGVAAAFGPDVIEAAHGGVGNFVDATRDGIDNLLSPDAGATPDIEGDIDGGGEGPDMDTSSQETQDAAGGPDFQNETFNVESGSGYTRELIDFAKESGHNLTPDQSYQLHQDLMRQFGSDYININGAGGDVYTSGGDVRLATPGSAQWADGVPSFVEQWVTSRGL